MKPAIFLFFLLWVPIHGLARGLESVPRVQFESNHRALVVEILQDDLIHFEVSRLEASNNAKLPDRSVPLSSSPMVEKRDFPGPSRWERTGNRLETARLRIDVDSDRLCVLIIDKIRGARLTQICPLQSEPGREKGPHQGSEQRSRAPSRPSQDSGQNQSSMGMTLTREEITQVYGLGEQFTEAGIADGQWVGRVRTPGGDFGNSMVPFQGGFTGNAQFPVFYALGDHRVNYALFVDDPYRQKWDWVNAPWKLETQGDTLRWYFIAGDDLPSLRQSFMNLVGRPLVPPRKAFGLWVSQYGFSNWSEIDHRLASLRANQFPVDGFILDLQWFGGVTANSDQSQMGSLRFDEVNFPDPQKKIMDYRSQGIGLVTIEESYVSRGLSEHDLMEGLGYFAKDCQNCNATYITENPWWGKGGLIDWTNRSGAAYWHDWKRQPLVKLGILGHWTDLGEPEMYNAWAWYAGFPEAQKFRHADVHNLFNLKWHESIFEGYRRNGVRNRPWMLTRSGAPGIQRYGAAMWSGDIGSNLASLASHLNAQMHLSFSGIDYFGADIGGFHRSALTGDLNEMYTQWFANGTSFDVPVRPHTENLCKCKETAPDRVGDWVSNRANLRTRYELIPYYYSLAHRAFLFGEPVIPPLVYYYQDDPNVREMGHEKLIGRDLLVAVVARHGEKERDVYLPAGEWIDYYTHQRYRSEGQWFRNLPEYRNGVFRLPIFVRAGAIIPRMHVDEKTLDAYGHRSDGSRREEMILRVYQDSIPNAFTVFEDDGWSMDYARGAVQGTRISQSWDSGTLTVTIEGTQGGFEGAPLEREYVIELVTGFEVLGVTLNGKSQGIAAWSQNSKEGMLRVKTGSLSTSLRKVFQFRMKNPSSK